MQPDSDREMAIPRMFNSSTPFIIVTGSSELPFLGKEDGGQGCEEEPDSLVQVMTPHLSHVMQHGTAKHVVTEGLEDKPCVSIVAQAEREDFQEFTPSSTECPFSRAQRLQKHRFLKEDAALLSGTEEEESDGAAKFVRHHLRRKKQRRKSRSRQSRRQEGEEAPVIRGLWVQEIDWLKTASSTELIPPPPEFSDSVPCCHGDLLQSCTSRGCSCAGADVWGSEEVIRVMDADDSSSTDNGASHSECKSPTTHEWDSDSSGCTDADVHSALDLMHLSGLTSSQHAELRWGSSGLTASLLGGSGSPSTCSSGSTSQSGCEEDTGDVIFDELKGKVTQVSKLFLSSCGASLKYMLNDWKSRKAANEGLIFHHLLRPSGCQYRDGEEYSVLHHIQNGSYGDVFCVRDIRTGFKCAAKRIPLSHFSSEELSTWSALNSPRVVELFGAVREGPHAVLFMDLKPACLAQLLRAMMCLPEDLALHYLHQSLEALEHLHNRNVLHLDVKADNVLLSADCRNTFLCDFGLSETLDDGGWSTKTFRGAGFPGTETHMAPEVARGDQLCAKADVWSSCCMLLHMLNGCQPWIRYYAHPLCLQIVNEPPPLWEVPSNCNNFTAKVFRAGLQKDPDRRASAKKLRRKTTKALRAVGGLSTSSVETAYKQLHHGHRQNDDDHCAVIPEIPVSPEKPAGAFGAPDVVWVSSWRTMAVEEDSSDEDGGASDQTSEPETDSATGDWDSHPGLLRDDCTQDADWDTGSDSEVDIYIGEEEFIQEKWLKTENDYEGDWEEGEDEEEDEEQESPVSTEYLCALRDLFPLLQKGQPEPMNDGSRGSEAELEYLRDDVPIGTKMQTPSPEPRDDPPSCFSCSDNSQIDTSEKDSEYSSDDLSSGVFSSCNSHAGGHLEWLAPANQPSSCCFDGPVFEDPRTPVSMKAFTLETLDRKAVSLEQEIKESGLWFCCVPAHDGCQCWRWRVRDGKLELRE
ncbi:STE20-like serine/threonine-protein kinase isoform X2 [Cololabis saira]|uniref:STE20-like serine/threonine-protein kinase isoform X2 n=1 Tax=Cololabis saira TaxID=129043 RepID=UPI002AD4D79D|nr:STE20-like serine/threonine-protein kinase isoform X2 [Cololabis saira]